MYSTTSELFSHIQLSVAPATGWLWCTKNDKYWIYQLTFGEQPPNWQLKQIKNVCCTCTLHSV